MHILRTGFFRGKQKRALSGLSGTALPPLRAGLLVADLAAPVLVPCVWPVWDCAVAGCPSWAVWEFRCCPRMGGVAAVGWAPGSSGGPNPEPPSPPALIGPSSSPRSPPCFLFFFFFWSFSFASFCFLRLLFRRLFRLLLLLLLLLRLLFLLYSRMHASPAPAWPRRRPSRRLTTPIDALSQRRPTTRCSSPACYGTELFRTSLRDLNVKRKPLVSFLLSYRRFSLYVCIIYMHVHIQLFYSNFVSRRIEYPTCCDWSWRVEPSEPRSSFEAQKPIVSKDASISSARVSRDLFATTHPRPD